MKKTIHDYFELSYASWLVLPRVLMRAMNDDWQDKFVKLLEELDETFDRDKIWEKGYPNVQVKGHDGKFISIKELGIPHYRHPLKHEIDQFRK